MHSSRLCTRGTYNPGMVRRSAVLLIALVVCVLTAVYGWRAMHRLERREMVNPVLKVQYRDEQVRTFLLKELQPIRLTNCELERFGEANDGGYLLCGNLLGAVKAGYSYGISGYDGWGCEISQRLKVKVHQYDCFDLTRPVCETGNTVFHGECVADTAFTDKDGRVFDTPEHQFAKNGDAGKHLVMKIDVEGAEWETFRAAPDGVLDQIDQLAVEFHGSGEERFADVVLKLKRFFYVANLHFNNYSCDDKFVPFPSWAYEVLFVSKRLGKPDTSGAPVAQSRLNAPNNPKLPDCQGRR
jgi:hypothetical protein